MHCNPSINRAITNSARPPRILHLVHWLRRGGIETWLRNLVQSVDRERMAIDICCEGPNLGDPNFVDEFRSAGVDLHLYTLRPTLLPFILRLRSLLLRKSYDLLHIHTDVHSAAAVLAANAAGVPAVMTLHNTAFDAETAWTRQPLVRRARSIYGLTSLAYSVRCANLVTGVSAGVVESVAKMTRYQGLVWNPLYLGIPTPLLLSERERNSLKHAIGLDERAIPLIHVGSLTERKNHIGLVRSFAEIARRVPDAYLLLAGEGDMRPTIEAQIAELGLSDRVKMLGLRNDVTALMQISRLMLFPSHHEGLPLTVVEAAATRTPLVASDLSAIREATNDGLAARLYAPTDWRGMANSAVELLSDEATASSLAEDAFAYYHKTFTMAACQERLESVYAEALGRSVPDFERERSAA